MCSSSPASLKDERVVFFIYRPKAKHQCVFQYECADVFSCFQAQYDVAPVCGTPETMLYQYPYLAAL